MVQAMPDHSDNRVLGILRKPSSFAKVAILKRRKYLLQLFRVALATLAPPPECPFAHYCYRHDSRNENRPHNWAARFEVFYQYVCQHIALAFTLNQAPSPTRCG